MNIRALQVALLALLLPASALRVAAQTARPAPAAPASAPFVEGPLERRGIGVVAGTGTDMALVFDTAQDRFLGAVRIPNRNGLCDVVIDRKREFAYLTTVGSEIAVLDLRGPIPVLAAGTNPIRLQSVGCDLALTPDERYLLTTGPDGGNFWTSVVDVAARREVFAMDFGAAPAIEAYGDGSVLLTTQLGIQWLAIDASGALVPKGAPLVTGGFNLLREPQGNSAVAFLQAELISFGAGLQQISSTPTVFTFPSSTSFAFDASGSWLFVRRSNSSGGTLEKLGYQDGFFAPSPAWVVPLAPAGLSQYGLERIAVDDFVGKIYAVEAGGVGVYSMATGARLAFLSDPDLAFPGGIDVVDVLGR